MKVGLWQDSHKIDYKNTNKKLILAGIEFEEKMSVVANSDGDVVLHAITNAISGITGKNILGEIADDMCKNNLITDSVEYLKEAKKYLTNEIIHLSISIECKTPKISPRIQEMRKNLSIILQIPENSIGITATTGEGLTECGKGNGISAIAIITVE